MVNAQILKIWMTFFIKVEKLPFFQLCSARKLKCPSSARHLHSSARTHHYRMAQKDTLVVAILAPLLARVLPSIAPPEDSARVSSGLFSKLTGTDLILWSWEFQSRLSLMSDCFGLWVWVVCVATSSDMLVSILCMVLRYLETRTNQLSIGRIKIGQVGLCSCQL